MKKEDSYEKAIEEWDAIQPISILQTDYEETTQVPDQTDQTVEDSITNSSQPIPSVKISCPSSASGIEVINDYCQHVNLSQEIPRIQKHPRKSKILIFLKKSFFLGPQTLRRDLRTERDRIIALALKPFDNQEPIHVKMLTLVYQHLMATDSHDIITTMSPSHINCPRIGSHWESIGFQGIDPVSDLRGVGLLGLYQLCFFVMSPLTRKLAHEIFLRSISSTFEATTVSSDHVPSPLVNSVESSFPFAIMGLNMTQIAIQCLRKGLLHKEINRRGSPVLLTFNLFYSSLFHRFLKSWKKHPNFASINSILNELRSKAGKGVKHHILTVLSFGDHLDTSNKRFLQTLMEGPQEKRSGAELTDTSIVFSDIGNIVEASSVEATTLENDDVNQDVQVDVFLEERAIN